MTSADGAQSSQAVAGIPDPAEVPFLRLWPETGRLLRLGRSATYSAVARGEIPVVKLGARLLVPTAALRRLAQLDVEEVTAANASPARRGSLAR
jgi:hypothetical protein